MRRSGEVVVVGGCPVTGHPCFPAMRHGMLPSPGTISPKPRSAGEARASYYCGLPARGSDLAGPASSASQGAEFFEQPEAIGSAGASACRSKPDIAGIANGTRFLVHSSIGRPGP